MEPGEPSFARRIRVFLRRVLSVLFLFARANLLGWWAVFRRAGGLFVKWAAGLTVYQVLFWVSVFSTLFLALTPWVEYQIHLTTPEKIRVGSSLKLLFLTPGIVAIMFRVFSLSYRGLVYYTVALAAMAVYVAGYFFPNPIHTSIVKAADFSFTPWIYAYGPGLLLGLLAEFGEGFRK